MHFKTVAPLVSLLVVAAAAIPHVRRDTISGNKIYAYGTGISGLPVYADASGIAYISSSNTSDLSSVTWTIATGPTVPWNVTLHPDNSTSSISGYKFFIVTTANSYSSAGFVSSNDTAPQGAQTTGFTLYGSDIMFISNSTYLSQFWAHETGVDGVWALMWNVNGTRQDDSEPVVLKTTAPASVGS